MQSVAIDILYQFPDITGTCCCVAPSIIERIFGWLIAYHEQHLPSTWQNVPYSFQNCLWGSEINTKTYPCPYNISRKNWGCVECQCKPFSMFCVAHATISQANQDVWVNKIDLCFTFVHVFCLLKQIKKLDLNWNLVSSEQNLCYSVHARIVQFLLHSS